MAPFHYIQVSPGKDLPFLYLPSLPFILKIVMRIRGQNTVKEKNNICLVEWLKSLTIGLRYIGILHSKPQFLSRPRMNDPGKKKQLAESGSWTPGMRTDRISGEHI